MHRKGSEGTQVVKKPEYRMYIGKIKGEEAEGGWGEAAEGLKGCLCLAYC